MFPNLIIWHCSNHRLELAVNDVVNEVDGINRFKIFMNKLYSLYHQSPKNLNELRQVVSSLEKQILQIGRILSVRWVASSKRTINAVLNNFSALYEHFKSASTDVTRDSKERSKYNGLKLMISSVEFVSNLNAMADALDELEDLSEYLQRRNITLVDADKAIRTTIRVFDSTVSEPGHKLSGALKAIELNIYKNVPIRNGKVKQINTSQLYRGLANNLRNRMITTNSSHVSQHEKDQHDNIYNYTNLINSLSVLDPKKWPTSDNDEVENITFGDDKIRHLCRHFKLNKENDIVRGFQIFKLEGGKEGVPDDLQILFKTAATIPISTSECERNFSSMNEIITPLRSSLNISTVSALLFINCVGPPLTEFRPEKYVRSWLAKGGHSADDNASRKRDKKIDDKYSALWKLL